jgi:hypothetical protein
MRPAPGHGVPASLSCCACLGAEQRGARPVAGRAALARADAKSAVPCRRLTRVGMANAGRRNARATVGRAAAKAWRWRAPGLRRPDLLVLDEPTASLDPHAKREVETLMAEFATGAHGRLARARPGDHGVCQPQPGPGQAPGQPGRSTWRAAECWPTCRSTQFFIGSACLQSQSAAAHLFVKGELRMKLSPYSSAIVRTVLPRIPSRQMAAGAGRRNDTLSSGVAQAQTTITMASTTSTEQSGLFGHLLPAFKTGHRHRRQGGGAGHRPGAGHGRRGDADVVFVHDAGGRGEVRRRGLRPSSATRSCTTTSCSSGPRTTRPP